MSIYKDKLFTYITSTNCLLDRYRANKAEYILKLDELHDTKKTLKETKSIIDNKRLHEIIDKEVKNIEYLINMYSGKIESLNTAIDKEERNLHFVRYTICPHELTEYIDTNYHTGEKEYKCCLCGARV